MKLYPLMFIGTCKQVRVALIVPPEEFTSMGCAMDAKGMLYLSVYALQMKE
jgi:hypothetical protein